MSAVGSLPVGEALSLFARASLARWDARVSVGGVGSESDNGTDLVWGVGAAYSFGNRFAVRGEWERTDFNGDKVDLLSVGITCSFQGIADNLLPFPWREGGCSPRFKPVRSAPGRIAAFWARR